MANFKTVVTTYQQKPKDGGIVLLERTRKFVDNVEINAVGRDQYIDTCRSPMKYKESEQIWDRYKHLNNGFK